MVILLIETKSIRLGSATCWIFVGEEPAVGVTWKRLICLTKADSFTRSMHFWKGCFFLHVFCVFTTALEHKSCYSPPRNATWIHGGCCWHKAMLGAIQMQRQKVIVKLFLHQAESKHPAEGCQGIIFSINMFSLMIFLSLSPFGFLQAQILAIMWRLWPPLWHRAIKLCCLTQGTGL